MMADILALWRAVLIIGVFSYALWKESPYFRLCEHAFLGTAMGYTLVVTIKTVYTTAVYPLVNLAQFIYIIPIVAGLMLYLTYKKDMIWLSRWPIAIIIGVGVALGMRGALLTFLISQVKTAISLPLTNINNVIMLITTVTVVLFFTFTILKGDEEGSIMFQVRKSSRLLIMVTLGAFFGSVTMARLTLIAGQIRQLLIAFGLM